MTGGSAPPLRTAVVGCGVIGRHHARVLTAHPAYTVVAAIDEVPESATAVAAVVEEAGGARPAVSATLGDALRGGRIDLVVICTPSGLHARIAEDAVNAGCHVVIEKPVDVSVARARRVAALGDLAAERGLVVSVISQHRFDPANRVVAEAAHAGHFGRVTSGFASIAWWRSQEYYDSGAWRGTWSLDGGGALMNQGVHTLDLLVWMLGRPVEVTAHTALLAHERIEVEDVATASIRFGSGALAVVHATTAAYPGLTTRLHIHGSAGSAIVSGDRLEYFHIAAPSGQEEGASSGRNEASDRVPPDQLVGGPEEADHFLRGHYRQYDDIAEAIVQRRAPGVTAAAALLSLATVKSVYASAALGRPVAVDDVLEGRVDDQALRLPGAT